MTSVFTAAESLTAIRAKGIRARIIESNRALVLARIFIGISLDWTMGAL
jgi:hypothetical protein